jgi:hypothetical protein
MTDTYGAAGEPSSGDRPYGEQPYGRNAPHLSGRPGFGPPGFGMRDPHARPGTVLAAGIVAMVSTGLVLLMQVFSLIVLLVARAALDLGEDPFFDDGRAGLLYVGLSVLMLVWCVLAIVFAVRAMHRSMRGRIGLVVSSSLTSAVSLVAIVSGVFGAALVLLSAIAVIVLLFTGGAGEWYRGRHDTEPVVPAY